LEGVVILRRGAVAIASIVEMRACRHVIDGDGNCHVYVDESPTSTGDRDRVT
jgi:gamma-glutamyl phosphate reductase